MARVRHAAVKVALVLIAATVLASCSSARERERFDQHGISFDVPAGWTVTGFSTTVTPRRLVAASYTVGAADVEGDCGGLAAVERLPAKGAYVVLIDYGSHSIDRAEFTDRRPISALSDGQLAAFECFGRSYAFRLMVRGRALQAHVGIGGSADSRRRSDALAVLNSLEAAAG